MTLVVVNFECTSRIIQANAQWLIFAVSIDWTGLFFHTLCVCNTSCDFLNFMNDTNYEWSNTCGNWPHMINHAYGFITKLRLAHNGLIILINEIISWRKEEARLNISNMSGLWIHPQEYTEYNISIGIYLIHQQEYTENIHRNSWVRKVHNIHRWHTIFEFDTRCCYDKQFDEFQFVRK